MEYGSSMRFSISVPVSTKACGARRLLTLRAVLVCQFLIRCASSSDDVGLQDRVDVVGISQHLLVIDDREEGGRAVGGEATPRAGPNTSPIDRR